MQAKGHNLVVLSLKPLRLLPCRALLKGVKENAVPFSLLLNQTVLSSVLVQLPLFLDLPVLPTYSSKKKIVVRQEPLKRGF